MSNYLSRLVAKQLGSSDGTTDSRIIQPRPVARFESVVSSVSQPLSAGSLPSSQVVSTQPLTQPSTQHSEMHRNIGTSQLPISSSSYLDNLFDTSLQSSQTSLQPSQTSLQPSQTSQSKIINHSVQRESNFSLPITFPVSTLSSDIVTPLSSSPILPLSQVNPISQPVLASEPLRFSSIQPALVPVSSPTMPVQPMQMPSPLLPVSDQRPRETQEMLPTVPLLVAPALPSALPSVSPIPSVAPVPTAIQVTIGRIEVRASAPSPVPSAVSSRPVGRMTLEEYLQRRNQGKKL